MKKMPGLDKLMHRRRERTRQTWEQQLSIVRQLHVAFGGTFKKK